MAVLYFIGIINQLLHRSFIYSYIAQDITFAVNKQITGVLSFDINQQIIQIKNKYKEIGQQQVYLDKIFSI